MYKFNLVLVLAFLSATAYGDLITFTSPGSINSLDNFDDVSVSMADNASVLNFNGGTVHNLTVWQGNVIQTGGVINGDLSTTFGSNGAYKMYGGSISGSGFYIQGGSVNVYGGVINAQYWKIYNNTVVNLLGGQVTAANFGLLWGHLNIWGSDYNYNSSTRTLTGKLADNSPFSLSGIWPTDYQNNVTLNPIPEPVSMLMLLTGALFIKKRLTA